MAADFDYKNPDYVPIYQERLDRLTRIRRDPSVLPALRRYYRDHIPQFISDWGVTTDPRNVEVDRPTLIPFLLFPRQVEWVEWLIESWRLRRPGVSPKSRESGLSWLSVSTACALCLHYEGFAFGFASRKEEYVDEKGAPKTLFWKARRFLDMLPPEFRGGYDASKDSPHMRILFPSTGSTITGEAGDNIGRGDRTSITVVDEAAFLVHPEMADAALSQTTNCRIDISTPNGIGNSFHRKVTEWPAERVFRFHWRDDPRKDQAWYDKQLSELDPVTVAQEIDIDFAASVEGVLIPSAFVQAAVDAHVVLSCEATGARFAALDVADEGADLNAFCGAHGFLIEVMEEWSGKGSDPFFTTEKAFSLCDDHGYDKFRFDADGIGSSIRGDARVINDRRKERGQPVLQVVPYRGSEGVLDPEKEDVKGRRNKDYFKNRKAQMGWRLRLLFQNTARVVQAAKEGRPYTVDNIISIPSTLRLKAKLMAELSQPTYGLDNQGKIIIDKAPDGMRSPNLYDAVVIRMAGAREPLHVPANVLDRSRKMLVQKMAGRLRRP